jgi:hypothetical protein
VVLGQAGFELAEKHGIRQPEQGGPLHGELLDEGEWSRAETRLYCERFSRWAKISTNQRRPSVDRR